MMNHDVGIVCDIAQEIHRNLSSEILRKRSVGLASWLIRKYSNGGRTLGGLGPSDIVQSAAFKAINGDRVWNQTVRFDKFFYGVIRSEVNNLKNIHYVKNRILEIDQLDYLSYNNNENKIQSPETIFSHNEKMKNIHSALAVALPNDNIAAKVAYFILCGFKKEEIAKKLNISKDEVRNAKRRIQRKLPPARDIILKLVNPEHK